MDNLALVEIKMDGITALEVATALKGQWGKQRGERDTEHAKVTLSRAIWRITRNCWLMHSPFSRSPSPGYPSMASAMNRM